MKMVKTRKQKILRNDIDTTCDFALAGLLTALAGQLIHIFGITGELGRLEPWLYVIAAGCGIISYIYMEKLNLDKYDVSQEKKAKEDDKHGKILG